MLRFELFCFALFCFSFLLFNIIFFLLLIRSLMSSNPRSMVASPQQIAKLAQEKKDREEKEKDARSKCEGNERNIGACFIICLVLLSAFSSVLTF
jgi:uncharacterized membrane protein